MLLQQYNETMRRYDLLGVGRVIGTADQPAVRRVQTSRFQKLSFGVRTGTRFNPNSDKVYQSVTCAAYGYDWNKAIFDAIGELQKGDLVFFCGHLAEINYEDPITGELKKNRECRVEWIQKIDSMGNITVLAKKDAMPIQENNDDYLF